MGKKKRDDVRKRAGRSDCQHKLRRSADNGKKIIELVAVIGAAALVGQIKHKSSNSITKELTLQQYRGAEEEVVSEAETESKQPKQTQGQHVPAHCRLAAQLKSEEEERWTEADLQVREECSHQFVLLDQECNEGHSYHVFEHESAKGCLDS